MMNQNDELPTSIGDHELCNFLEELSFSYGKPEVSIHSITCLYLEVFFYIRSSLYCEIMFFRFRRIVSQGKRKLMAAGEGFDSILLIQRRSRYSFIQGSRFPGQGGHDDKCYVFKMSLREDQHQAWTLRCLCEDQH